MFYLLYIFTIYSASFDWRNNNLAFILNRCLNLFFFLIHNNPLRTSGDVLRTSLTRPTHPSVAFRVTQLLSGHALLCFNSHVFAIGRGLLGDEKVGILIVLEVARYATMVCRCIRYRCLVKAHRRCDVTFTVTYKRGHPQTMRYGSLAIGKRANNICILWALP